MAKQEYTVELELLVDAESPEDAALEAELMIADPMRGAFVWDVTPAGAGPHVEPVRVDVETLGDGRVTA